MPVCRYTYLRDDMNKFHNPFSKGACGNALEVCSRRETVLANPYSYTEAYEKFQMQASSKDLEMAEMGAEGETERLAAPAHSHNHSHFTLGEAEPH